MFKDMPYFVSVFSINEYCDTFLLIYKLGICFMVVHMCISMKKSYCYHIRNNILCLVSVGHSYC